MPRKGENIYKRKDGRWEGRYILSYNSEHKAKYAYVYGKTYSEVKKRLLEEKGKEKKINSPPKKSSTYSELLDSWLHSMNLSTKESTQARYAHLIATHIKPQLGAYEISQLSTEVIENFIEQQLVDGRLDNNGGLSSKTVIDILFPFLGVRFIAVNDGFDSSRPQDIDSLDTSFKTLIYDLYSRELSGKVKNAKRMRAEKGLFLSPFAPYGYVKDPDDKNRLIIDDEAADIVKKIFTLTADGVKPTEIAAMLNREGVPTPMLYKRAAGCSRDRWPSIHEENFWTQGNIFKILRDERYIGKCVYGKRERDMVGNWHTVRKSKSDWIVVDETHEGIVSKELFEQVASRMKEYKEFIPSTSQRNPLRRKVICGTCGFAMSLSNTKNAKYHCRTSHLETGFDCTSEGILQADIHEMVVTLIRTYAAYAVSLEHLLLLQKERIQAEKKQARRELAVLQSRRNQYEKSLQDLYEKLIDGTIDKETYLSQKASNQSQMQELTEKMERLEKSSQTTTEQGGAFIEKYKEYTELETLTTEITNDVVKRVTVYKDGGIEIELALRDELEELLNCLETLDAAS